MLSSLYAGCTYFCSCRVLWKSYFVSVCVCVCVCDTCIRTCFIHSNDTGPIHILLPNRFHTGSLAFGALIIAIVQMIRIILAYIQKKLKNRTGKIAKALLCLLQCCFWCLEKFLKYVNRQAYIEVSVSLVDVLFARGGGGKNGA